MFERYTEKAIKVVVLAEEESRRLRFNNVDTEQLLIALIWEGTGTAAKILKSMGMNLKDARYELQKILHIEGPNEITPATAFTTKELLSVGSRTDLPFAPSAKRILEQTCWEEARQLGHNYIGTEHLLLALIREIQNPGLGPCVASQILDAHGMDPEKIREHIIRVLTEQGKEPAIERPTASRVTATCPYCAERIEVGAIVCKFCFAGISKDHFRECPACMEMIRKEATLCRYCRSKVKPRQ